MNSGRKNRLILMGLGGGLLLTVLFSFGIGRYPISPGEVIGIVSSKALPIEPFWTQQMETIFFNVRLPRILLSCMVGCSLAAAGATYQGIFRNPMAAPDILGASTGAAYGAALAIMNYWGKTGANLSAFAFGMGTVAVVYLLSKRTKGSKTLGLVLSGIIISSLFSAGTSYLKLVADPNDQLPAITYWLMGSLSGARVSDFIYTLIPMTAGLIPLLLLRWKINVLTLGDAEARTMGVNTGLVRLIVITAATLVTASSVALCGVIGWVGLVIPHLARRLVGNNYNVLMPASMLLGAVFLLIVDNIARTMWTSEIPIGILTAFIGAPFFIYLITKESKAQ